MQHSPVGQAILAPGSFQQSRWAAPGPVAGALIGLRLECGARPSGLAKMKAVRKKLHRDSDEKTVVRLSRPKARLKKERGVWVYQGASTDASIIDVIHREREKRIRELTR